MKLESKMSRIFIVNFNCVSENSGRFTFSQSKSKLKKKKIEHISRLIIVLARGVRGGRSRQRKCFYGNGEFYGCQL